MIPPFGLPRDSAQWIALALAALALPLAPRALRAGSARLFLAIAAVAATALSAAYVAVYLRGGPRIIDATSYYLEARGIAGGMLSFPLHAPETSVLGRFLVRSVHPDGPHAAVIFPPGWPAVLALGFLVRAPMAVGPAIAGALVLVTFDLARHLADGASPSVPRLAAAFSVLCAALRYHTADTMSHGLAALCAAGAIALVFRAIDASGRRAILLAAGAGLAAGWLFATRPVSAIALAFPIAAALLHARRARLAIPLALGSLPALALFFAHQRAATGAWGASSQQLYYALSDGPPGCFRYGFGAGIGCAGEHGDFVKARLGEGFGAIAAAGTTLRRLKMHLVDPLNLEPLALLVPAGAWIRRSSPRGRVLALFVVAQILAYVPFYFDGNYPGGGGRFFCDALPFEHALAAAAAVAIAARARAPERWIAAAVALALAGFAFRAGFDHAQLRDREGGRPLFLPADVASIPRGLVFADTDHGFNLGHDPSHLKDLTVLRAHGDALDRFAWEARGRPPAFLHHVEIPPGGGPARVTVTPRVFAEAGDLVIEGEALWPPAAQRGAYALPSWASGTCASGARLLTLHGAGSITLPLPSPWLARRRLSPRLALTGGARGEVLLRGGGAVIHRWPFTAATERDLTCLDLPAASAPQGVTDLEIEIARKGDLNALVALDAVSIGPSEND